MPNQPNGDPGEVVISASIAYDYLMSFGGSLADHILPDKTHVISVSFLVDSLRRYRGGVAGNICYNLALLGVRPTLVGAVGSDFGPYRGRSRHSESTRATPAMRRPSHRIRLHDGGHEEQPDRLVLSRSG